MNSVEPESAHNSSGGESPDVESPDVESPDIESPDGDSPNIDSPNIESPHTVRETPKSLPGEDFVSRVLAVVESIPAGRVMTYGDVAAALGSRAARAVGQTMAYYGSDVAWWRVVRASGHPAIDHESRALEYFRVEGTPLKWSTSGVFRVDLATARYFGDDSSDAGSDSGSAN